MSNIPTIRIAMFGSRSTGKTTFLSSFVCPVTLQGCSLAITDPETKTYLNQNWSQMMNGEKPGATSMMIKDKLWFSLRYPNKREEQDEDAWKIQIKDYPGRLVEWDDPNQGGAWDETKKDELSQEFKKKLEEHIQEADAILFLAPVDIAEWKPKDQKLYMAYINDIIEIAKQSRGDYSASIPFCMALMKWDMTDIALEPLTMNPEADFPLDSRVDDFMKEHPIFQKIYGIINASSNEDVTVFATSAFGAHATEDHTRPDPDNLEPFNVLPVLYWLCRKAEAVKVRVAERKVARITTENPSLTDENYQEIQKIYEDLLAEGINDIDKRKEIMELSAANRNAHIDFLVEEISTQCAIIDQKRFHNKPAEKLKLLRDRQIRKLFRPEEEIDLQHDIEAMAKLARKRSWQLFRHKCYCVFLILGCVLLGMWGFQISTTATAFTEGEGIIAKAPENLTKKDFESAEKPFSAPRVLLENYIPGLKGRRENFQAKMKAFNQAKEKRMEERLAEFPVKETDEPGKKAEIYQKRLNVVQDAQAEMTREYSMRLERMARELEEKQVACVNEQIQNTHKAVWTEMEEKIAQAEPAEEAELSVKIEAYRKQSGFAHDAKTQFTLADYTQKADNLLQNLERKITESQAEQVRLANEAVLKEMEEKIVQLQPAEDAEPASKREAFSKMGEAVKEAQSKITDPEIISQLERRVAEYEVKQSKSNDSHLLKVKIGEIEGAEPEKVLALLDSFGTDADGKTYERTEFPAEFERVDQLRKDKIQEFETGLKNELSEVSIDEQAKFQVRKEQAEKKQKVYAKYLARYPENEKYTSQRDEIQKGIDQTKDEINVLEKHIPLEEEFEKAMQLQTDSDAQLLAVLRFLKEYNPEDYSLAKKLFTEATQKRDEILGKIKDDWSNETRDCADQNSDDLETRITNVQKRLNILETYVNRFSMELQEYEQVADLQKLFTDVKEEENRLKDKLDKWNNFQNEYNELKAAFDKWESSGKESSVATNLIDEINEFFNQYNEQVFRSYSRFTELTANLNVQKTQLSLERNIKEKLDNIERLKENVRLNSSSYSENKRKIKSAREELNQLGTGDFRLQNAKEKLNELEKSNNTLWENSEWRKVTDAMERADKSWSEGDIDSACSALTKYNENYDAPRKRFGDASNFKLYYQSLLNFVSFEVTGVAHYDGDIDNINGDWRIFVNGDEKEETYVECRKNGQNRLETFTITVTPTKSMTIRLQLDGRNNFWPWLNREHANDGQASITLHEWLQTGKFTVPINCGHVEFVITNIGNIPSKPSSSSYTY